MPNNLKKFSSSQIFFDAHEYNDDELHEEEDKNLKNLRKFVCSDFIKMENFKNCLP